MAIEIRTKLQERDTDLQGADTEASESVESPLGETEISWHANIVDNGLGEAVIFGDVKEIRFNIPVKKDNGFGTMEVIASELNGWVIGTNRPKWGENALPGILKPSRVIIELPYKCASVTFG